ncbi:hypothetical protein BVD23_11425 [Salmonella enterica]|nr:hypothetical protein [Salmonella enterica]EAN4946332.1 hypothetical protein [Salmonella enterica]EBI7618316.1 hypothetical protein [Salmonella enterica]EBI8099498.1 hypothetical protein [Salmonella enterica]EBK3004800.1 hypothetical protein [Salmonella enterica]
MYRIKDGALLIKITALLFFHVIAKDEIFLYDIFRSTITVDLMLFYCFILVVFCFIYFAMAQ